MSYILWNNNLVHNGWLFQVHASELVSNYSLPESSVLQANSTIPASGMVVSSIKVKALVENLLLLAMV